MEFNFNDSQIGQKIFPNGCPYCGSDVEFKSYLEVFGYEKEGWNMYVCSSGACGAYVYAHREDKGEAIKNMPMGILANKELRSVHDCLRSLFNPLWQHIAEDHTPLVNHVFSKLVLAFTDPDGENRYGVVDGLDRESRTYTIITETGATYSVPINMTQKVDMRTKAYFWLATQLLLPYEACKIPMLDYETSGQAIDILEKATKSLNIKQNASND